MASVEACSRPSTAVLAVLAVLAPKRRCARLRAAPGVHWRPLRAPMSAPPRAGSAPTELGLERVRSEPGAGRNRQRLVDWPWRFGGPRQPAWMAGNRVEW